MPARSSAAAIVCGLPRAHVDDGGIGDAARARPVVRRLALAHARRHERDAARDAALRERDAELRARRERGGDAGHDLERDRRPLAARRSLPARARTASGRRPSGARRRACLRAASIRRLLMKRCAVECLPERLPTATCSARAASAIVSGCTSASWNTMSARLEHLRRAQREEIRRAGPGADEIDLAACASWLTRRAARRFAPAEERQRALDRSLVALAEIVERRRARRRGPRRRAARTRRSRSA